MSVIFISANAERLLGHTPDELLETPDSFNARIHPDDVEQLRSEYVRAMAAQEGQLETEYRFLHKDGTYRWIFGVARIKYGEDGAPQEILGYGLDITVPPLIAIHHSPSFQHLSPSIGERTVRA